jgi:hypothetical protein
MSESPPPLPVDGDIIETHVVSPSKVRYNVDNVNNSNGNGEHHEISLNDDMNEENESEIRMSSLTLRTDEDDDDEKIINGKDIHLSPAGRLTSPAVSIEADRFSEISLGLYLCCIYALLYAVYFCTGETSNEPSASATPQRERSQVANFAELPKEPVINGQTKQIDEVICIV